jgi:hypothetical protein
MYKKIAALVIFLVLVTALPVYLWVKADTFKEGDMHYDPYGDNPRDLSTLTDSLETRGAAKYTTRTIVSSPVLLRGIKDPEQTCYVVVGVDREYRTEEIDVIESFIKDDGGKAIIMDDFGAPNALSERFGVFFYGRPLWDDINMTGPPDRTNISFPTFRATLGLQDFDIIMNSPTGLTTTNPNVEYIANGSIKSYVDLDGNGRVNIGDKKGNIPVIVEVHFNDTKGRVVFISNANLATNDMIKASDQQNMLFMVSLVNRLMNKKEALILFDESRHEHKPTQTVLYKNIETVAVMTSWLWPILGTSLSMLVVFSLVVYSSPDKKSWIHRFDVSAFSRRFDPPDKLKDQIERSRHSLMLKVRTMFSYSVEEMATLSPDQLRAMIKEPDLVELVTNPNRQWSAQEIRVVIQRIKDWGGKTM